MERRLSDPLVDLRTDYLVEQSPEKYRQWAQLRVEALNHALEGIAEDRVRYHVCFGSWHVPHVADAPFEEIIDLIFQFRAGAYSMQSSSRWCRVRAWLLKNCGHRDDN